MPIEIASPEIVGVTESSLTLAFDVVENGRPVDAEAQILVDGAVRATSTGEGARFVRIEGLEAGMTHRVEIHVPGAESPAPDRYFPEVVETLPACSGDPVGTFATMNDLHFGEPRFGGTLAPDGEFAGEAPGFGIVYADESDEPYWRFMNEDAIDEINGLDVDMTIIKGDIADRGRPEQFEEAAKAFNRFSRPHHAFLGNHDYYGLEAGLEVDGYALLGQPPAPRSVDLGGWRLLLLETVEPGEHHGVFGDERLRWLDENLDETHESDVPTLLFMHHHPVPPEFRDSYPNTIGIDPEHSLRLFDILGRHPQVRGVLIGHTHRNRIRHYSASGGIPFIEVNCTKDYPGGFAHYRLFEDGSFRQEVCRTSSDRALAHSSRCRDFFKGGYRQFALGALETRSFATGPLGARS